ncbi:MAG: hypothetical protein V4731_00210 [Pseudomonadota bacterium]
MTPAKRLQQPARLVALILRPILTVVSAPVAPQAKSGATLPGSIDRPADSLFYRVTDATSIR